MKSNSALLSSLTVNLLIPQRWRCANTIKKDAKVPAGLRPRHGAVFCGLRLSALNMFLNKIPLHRDFARKCDKKQGGAVRKVTAKIFLSVDMFNRSFKILKNKFERIGQKPCI